MCTKLQNGRSCRSKLSNGVGRWEGVYKRGPNFYFFKKNYIFNFKYAAALLVIGILTLFVSDQMVNEDVNIENGRNVDNGDKFAIVGLAGGIAIMVAIIVAIGASKFLLAVLL